MLRRIGAFLLSAALMLVALNAFRQVPNEFRDTAPGSLLFGLLQLLIGTSAIAAAVGLMRRTRWASPAVGVWGAAAAALLVAQPVYEPMPRDVEASIWFGAALVGGCAAGVSWFARRQARPLPTSEPHAPLHEPSAPAPHVAQLPPEAAAQVHDPIKEAESLIRPSRRA